MPVYFKRTDAKLGRLIGVCTVIASVFILGGGDILPGVFLVIAGAFVFAKSDPNHSALRDLGVKLVYFLLIGIAVTTYVALN
ncbi:hypothetical protein [Saliphagus sp. LR7]|uniref:hypothetical protein n=1 Tax=Saliphagus sp. LR7 TaxID=2282654 RepID=UPI0013008F12|nr:hypothetical protein [Saliphagus sp. LR7]